MGHVDVIGFGEHAQFSGVGFLASAAISSSSSATYTSSGASAAGGGSARVERVVQTIIIAIPTISNVGTTTFTSATPNIISNTLPQVSIQISLEMTAHNLEGIEGLIIRKMGNVHDVVGRRHSSLGGAGH